MEKNIVFSNNNKEEFNQSFTHLKGKEYLNNNNITIESLAIVAFDSYKNSINKLDNEEAKYESIAMDVKKYIKNQKNAHSNKEMLNDFEIVERRSPLTAKQFRIFNKVICGNSFKEIAMAEHKSIKAINAEFNNAKKKLGSKVNKLVA